MIARQFRTIVAMALVVALATGIAAHCVAGPEAKGSPVVAADMSMPGMPGDCDGCRKNSAGPEFCPVVCVGATILPQTAELAYFAPLVRTLALAGPARLADLHGPPDPYPPRIAA